MRPKKLSRIIFRFSLESRVCLGKYFGQVELVMSFATLAQRFRLTLPLGTSVKHECRLTLRPAGGLPMQAQAR